MCGWRLAQLSAFWRQARWADIAMKTVDFWLEHSHWLMEEGLPVNVKTNLVIKFNEVSVDIVVNRVRHAALPTRVDRCEVTWTIQITAKQIVYIINIYSRAIFSSLYFFSSSVYHSECYLFDTIMSAGDMYQVYEINDDWLIRVYWMKWKQLIAVIVTSVVNLS